jgi:hypothetical protein
MTKFERGLVVLFANDGAVVRECGWQLRRSDDVDVCVAVRTIADEEDVVVREAVWKMDRQASEVTAGEDVWILAAELFEDDADLFGSELLAGEGILETASFLEGKIG